jgi:4-hydroxythreonine-4-phosphate dehydrogenase
MNSAAPTALERPLLGLTLGDPAGIGPEIVLAAARDESVRAVARLRVFGPARLRPEWIEPERAERALDVAWVETGELGDFEHGRVQPACGRAALDALRTGVEWARARRIDALVTAPVSKEALHAAGERVEGQTELLARWDGATRYEMVAIAGRMRVMLLTRHMPLRQALESVTSARVEHHLVLLDETLRDWGFERPQLALAGLNPHAGEGGLLGREEIEVLEPALARVRSRGIKVAGPVSPDSVFLGAARGDFDAVLALYHDQAFIPVKLAGARHGLTVIAGLSFLRVSPAHGTAFDIAGKGLASPHNLVVALLQTAAWRSGRPMAVVE